MRFIAAVVMLLLLVVPAGAENKTVTYYLDGARVEQEAAAVKGYLEIPLPEGMRPNSLRIRPAKGCELKRVEIVPIPPTAKRDKEELQLAERRDRLSARLKALDTREDIFKAAAKSQSGKAPRKTKTNPEPLTNIRRGTEFALSQLEEVYRLRLQTERELREIETRLSAASKGKAAGKSQARVWLQGKEGRVHLSYLLDGRGWQPRYDFRLDGAGGVAVSQSAHLLQVEKGAELFAVAAALASSRPSDARHSLGAGLARVAEYRFPAEKETFSASPLAVFSFSLKNNSSEPLPSGEATCYLKGEYLGTVAFPGALPGESREVACGRQGD